MGVQRIFHFDLWTEGYAAAIVTIRVAGTGALASIYTDEALASAASNPQTLLSLTQNERTYGKWTQPLYTNQAYYLDVDSTNQSGVQRVALTTLVGEDASEAVATATGGTEERNIEDHFGQAVYAEDYGVIGASGATNNATIVAAVGAASGNGGGRVILPDGTVPFTSFTLPLGVVLQGRSQDATILQSETADEVITLGGDRAGFMDLTLDGVSLQAGSVGVYSKANNEVVMERVKIKRFATGMHFRGGHRMDWHSLSIDNCATGGKLHGDNDATGGANGDHWQNNRWEGGLVTNCTTRGIDLSYEDKRAWHNTLVNVGFEDNTGAALRVNGARYTRLPGCWMSGNTTDLQVLDDTDVNNTDENTVIGFEWDGGLISGGTVSLGDTCQDVVLKGLELSGATVSLATTLKNNILAINCIEDSSFALSGVGIRWVRSRSLLSEFAGGSGVTTDAVATTAWSIRLEPGQVGIIRAMVKGTQQNGVNYATYHIARPVRRPGSILTYKSQTANYTLGGIVTGSVSGATGRIVANTDAGATGTITLRRTKEESKVEFLDLELVTEDLGGSATADGTLSHQNATLVGSTTSIQAAVETDGTWACDFAAVNLNVEVQVTGAAALNVDWQLAVEALLD